MVQKSTPSAFDGTILKAFLDEFGIKTIVVCGLHSEHCFTNTSFSALELGLEVIAVGDAHGTSHSDLAESLKVVDRQNELLGEKGGMIVTTSELLSMNFGDLIETERLVVGRFEDDDFDPLLSLMTDAESMRFTGFKEPQSEEKVRGLLFKWKKEGLLKMGVWAIRTKFTKEFVGWVMLKPIKTSIPELGYMIY